MPYHQPVVSTTTGEVVGPEALVRWEDPTRGVLASGAFIGVALETAEQLAALAVIGCDASQGFLIARPMPAASVPAHLGQAAVLPRPACAGAGR